MNVPLQEQQILDMPNTAPLPTMPATSAPQFFDKPSKNDVMTEDTNEVDLDENSPIVIPPGVKLEVEGGDTIAPPGFEPQTPPIKN